MTTRLVGSEREQAIRSEVQEEFRRAIDADALFTPGPADVEHARRLIGERIAAAQRQAATLGEPPIADPDSLARRLFDDLLGLGPLQPLLDDPLGRRDHHQRPAARLRDQQWAQAPLGSRLRGRRRAASADPARHRTARAAAGRGQPDGRRAALGRLPPQRGDPAADLWVAARHDPQVSAARPHARRPRRAGDADPRGRSVPAGSGAGRPQHPHRRRDGQRQDNVPERARLVRRRSGRAGGDDRGDCRTPTRSSAAGLCRARGALPERRWRRRDRDPLAREERAADAPHAHRRRRGPRRRGTGHAHRDELGPRRLDVHHPRERSARRRSASSVPTP